jgi:hypothetical protein
MKASTREILQAASESFSCPKGEEQARRLKSHLQGMLDSTYAVLQLRRGGSWSVEVSSLFGWRKENLEQAKLVTSEVKKFLG